MLEHEESLIEAMLYREAVIDECEVTGDLFSDPRSRAIFEAISATRRENVKVDSIAVGDTLRRSGREDLIPALAAYNPFTSANASYYAMKLREERNARILVPILRDAINDLEKSPDALRDAILKLSDGLIDIERSHRASEDPSIAANLKGYLAELERRCEDDGRSGANFGLDSIDRILGSNITAGELIGIAARPSVGKTALSIQMAIHNAVYRGIKPTIFSLEMTRNQIYDRVFAPCANGGLRALKNGLGIKSKRTIDGIKDQTARIHDGGVRIYQESMTPESLIASIRREAMVCGSRLFVIDYLGLIDFGHKGNMARWERVGDTSRALKRLALDLNVAIVMCVQLGRQAENKEPTIADLRDSGAIEQDCNRVFLLHRPDISDLNAEVYEVDVIVAKNREGPKGRARLMFQGPIARFEEMPR